MSLTLIYLCVVNLFYLLVTSESATWLDQPDHGIDSKPLLGKCMYVVSVTASWVNILSVQSRRLAGNTTHFGPKTPNAFVYLFVSNQACMYLWVVADLLLAAYYYEVLRILISPAAISIVFDAAWFFLTTFKSAEMHVCWHYWFGFFTFGFVPLLLQSYKFLFSCSDFQNPTSRLSPLPPEPAGFNYNNYDRDAPIDIPLDTTTVGATSEAGKDNRCMLWVSTSPPVFLHNFLIIAFDM